MFHFAKMVKVCIFPDNFQKFQKNPKKLEFWNSGLKIKLSDQNWVGKIPNMLKLAKNSKFRRISRFPETFWKKSRKIWNLKFWVQNQAQWPKLSGKNTQHIEIGQKTANSRAFWDFPIVNFQFPENFRKLKKCEKLLWICYYH